MLDGPPLAGASDAALDFIRDQQNAVLVANAAQFFHEDRGSDYVSAFALHRFHEDGCHFFRSHRGFEQLVFDEAGAAQSKRLAILRAAFATAIHIGIAHVRHARNRGPKRRFCCGFEAVSESAPMVRPWNAPKNAITFCRLV